MFFSQLTHFLHKKSYQHNDFPMVNNEFFFFSSQFFHHAVHAEWIIVTRLSSKPSNMNKCFVLLHTALLSNLQIKLSSHKIVVYPDIAVPKIPEQFHVLVSTVAANEHIPYEMLTIQLGWKKLKYLAYTNISSEMHNLI